MTVTLRANRPGETMFGGGRGIIIPFNPRPTTAAKPVSPVPNAIIQQQAKAAMAPVLEAAARTLRNPLFYDPECEDLGDTE